MFFRKFKGGLDFRCLNAIYLHLNSTNETIKCKSFIYVQESMTTGR